MQKIEKEDVSQAHGLRVSGSQSINMASVAGESPEDASMSLPSELRSTGNTLEENFKLLNAQRDQPGISARSGSNDIVVVETGNVLAELQKKVHFTTKNNATSRKMGWEAGNQLGTSTAVNQDWQHRDIQSIEMDNSLRSEGRISSLVARKTIGIQDQRHHSGNLLWNDLNNAMTQSSVVESSCFTSTVIDSMAAPMISSTTCFSQTQISSANLGTDRSLLEKPTCRKMLYSHHILYPGMPVKFYLIN
ncbi:hypothetical protein CDL12_27551 [Handroanthus impetiginosus]|uniref:Uncharacterized protein n=1 Tax=Handroanthus impetiginosus TaxID=429701 RepID=A0A2G9G3R9_9LAMI|nr:hypothetical protein CDL12_27551 [Handroanthus impetiginosus]